MRNLDMQKTAMQSGSSVRIQGWLLSEVLEVVNDLGIDPRDVAIDGDKMFVIPEHLRGAIEELDRMAFRH